VDRFERDHHGRPNGVRPWSPTVLSAVRIHCWSSEFQAAGAGVAAGARREDWVRITHLRSSSAPQAMNGNGISTSMSRAGGTAVPSSA